MKTKKSKEHLCDSCAHQYPDCETDAYEADIDMDLHFGNDVGNDNIIECNFWEIKN